MVCLEPLRVKGRPRAGPCCAVAKLSKDSNESQLEMDSHADTTTLGKHALITHDWMRPCNVFGFDEDLGDVVLQTVTGVLACDHPETGQRYHLVFHQALHHPRMDHHLLCLFQSRVNGIEINDVPRHLMRKPTNESHSIVVPDPFSKDDSSVVLPMYLDGVTSYLPVYMPTKEEYESGDYPEIEMTSAELEWDPQTDQFERCENAMLDAHGNLREGLPTKPKFVIKKLQTESLQGDLVDITDDAHLGSVLESNVNVSLTGVRTRNLSRLARVERKLKELELAPRDGEFPLNSGKS